jgi:polyphosphate kinase
MCLVIRREGDRLVRYVHLSTGNYNPRTARVYTDLALLTSSPAITSDAGFLFNALTGYARHIDYHSLLVAPEGLREGNAPTHRTGHRLPSRHGPRVYRIQTQFPHRPDLHPGIVSGLSQAGVTVDLQVRGICSLRPGVEA